MALIISPIADNRSHQHYAVQLTFTLSGAIYIDDKKVPDDCSLLKVMEKHRLSSTEEAVVLLLNPASSMANWLTNHVSRESLIDLCNELRLLVVKLFTVKENCENKEKIGVLKAIEDQLNCKKSMSVILTTDPRIAQVISQLKEATPKIISAQASANQCSLSTSRFLWLFKKDTGITYRRFQLWLRLMASIDCLNQDRTITTIAHQHGFSDSAHYSRTFKECFGYSPKIFSKIKRQKV